MKTRKTIKWIASILGASILVSTAAFTVVSCSSSEPASNKYSPEEQKIINYRTEFKDKFYQFIVEKSNEKYGSFTTECNDVLKKASVSVYKNLNDEKWWYSWRPYDLIAMSGEKYTVTSYIGNVIEYDNYYLVNDAFVYIYKQVCPWGSCDNEILKILDINGVNDGLTIIINK